MPSKRKIQFDNREYWGKGWAEEANEKFRNRNITLEIEEDNQQIETANKLMMGWAKDYAERKTAITEEIIKVLKIINGVRQNKRALLPFELFELKGLKRTACGLNTTEKSTVM